MRWIAVLVSGLVSLSYSAIARGQQVPAAASCGYPSHGTLIDGQALPIQGPHHRFYEPWSLRNRRFGTPELVGLLSRAAAAVARAHPGSVLAIGDMSHRDGGPISGHRSHQSGRDVDLIYFARKEDGGFFVQDRFMGDYRIDGRADSSITPGRATAIAPRWFDRARNWTLVKALLTDQTSIVLHVFVSERVEKWLLAHAREIGEPPTLVARARRIMRRPRQVSGRRHNDHMHVRVACSTRDLRSGACLDGPMLEQLSLTDDLGCPRVVPVSMEQSLARCRALPVPGERARCRRDILKTRSRATRENKSPPRL